MIYSRKVLCLKLSVLFLLSSFLNAQIPDLIDSKKFHDQTLGGECLVKSSKIDVDGEISMKIFEIEVAEEGEYYLSAWMMNTGIIEKNNGLKFYIDDEKNSSGKLKPLKESWQSVQLLENSATKSKKLKLASGRHTVTFCSTIPEIPPVEFIRIARTEPDSRIPDDNWRNYFEAAKNNTFNQPGDSQRDIVLSKINEEPKYLYEVELNQHYSYTYFTYLYLTVGSIELETRKASPTDSDPIMYLFSYQNPNSFSVYDDESGLGHQALIIAQIPASGTYCVLVRSKISNQSQTSDLYLNNNLYASNIVISGASISCSQSLTQQLNYFTSYPTGDPKLWIQRNDNTIRGFNDDYSGSGNFVWQQNARVKYTLDSGQSINNCILTSSSTYYPTGYSDLYMGCRNYTGTRIDAYFKADDAIMSGNHTAQHLPDPEQPDYNCFAWTGGMTSTHIDPQAPGTAYFVSGNALQSFDNFYGNNPIPRYSGAWTYTRTTTSGNSLIDLCWNIGYTHFGHATINSRWVNNPTVKKANDQAHGYDWESKDSNLERFFHPRFALNYDFPIAYYYTISGLAKNSSATSKNDNISEEESIKRGLSIVERVKFTNHELFRIGELKKELLDNSVLNEFSDKYEIWKNTWFDISKCSGSSLRSHAESDEYFNLINYCNAIGKKVLPLLLEKLNAEKYYYVIMPIYDLTYKGNEKLMEEVLDENNKNLYTKEGVYIIYTQHGNWIKYGKKLLSNFHQLKGFTFNIEDNKLNSNTDLISDKLMIKNYPNPFNPETNINYNIPSDRKISIRIYDILGNEVTTLIENEFQTAGLHNIIWNGRGKNNNSLSSGIYFCRIVYDSDVKTIKLILLQ